MDYSDIDSRIRAAAKKEYFGVSKSASAAVDNALSSLPDEVRKKPRRRWRVAVASAAAAVVITFVILPNASPVVARALSSVPVVGRLVKLVTIRYYEYNSDFHYADVKVPELYSSNGDAELQKAISSVNEDANDLVNWLIERFENETSAMGNTAHTSLYAGYEILTNNDRWFAMRIVICEAAGSSDTYYKYYNIDMKSKKLVQLSDLFSGGGYINAISENIKTQMRRRMKEDSSLVYWIDSTDNSEWDFKSIDKNQNFYIDNDGTLVISFDKYAVGPGIMGCQEFEIPSEIYKTYQ